MKPCKLFWIPRILMIVFVIFISLFAFDTFEGEASLLLKIEGFLIHLIPSFVIITVLIVSWKHPIAGGVSFIVLSLLFTIVFRTYEFVLNFLFVSFPLVLAGAMLIIFSIIKNCHK